VQEGKHTFDEGHCLRKLFCTIVKKGGAHVRPEGGIVCNGRGRGERGGKKRCSRWGRNGREL